MPSAKLLKQFHFAHMVAMLLTYAHSCGYQITFGDAWSKPEYKAHKPNSKHYDRLAIDINLFKDGVYLTGTNDHALLGAFWESAGGVWGGRFNDGNHYEL